MVSIGGGYYDPLTGRYMTRAGQNTNSYELEVGDSYLFSRIVAHEKLELTWSGFINCPGRWFVAQTLAGLHDSSANFGDAVGRYDSGRATMGEVVLKGGMAAFQVISVALPAGKGLTALGRTGSHLLAASVAEAAEEDLLAIVGEDGNKKIVVNLGGEGETGAGTINVQHIGAESPMYGGSRPEVQGMSLRQIAAKYPDQHFIITDYSRLPFRANSVDVIHVNGTRIGGAYRGVPYPQLDEILRVLKDDGQFFRDGVLQGRPQ